jgi:molybdenum cofactor biosynthesis enzyme
LKFLIEHFGIPKYDLDIDISIDPYDELPANGTVVISTEGATDLDMNKFPPLEVTVVTINDIITVTNQTVTVSNTNSDNSEENNGGGDEK